MTSQFMAYDEGYTGGVCLSTGWVAGAEGGAKSIVTSQLAGDGTVRAWSSGSLLDGQPGIYLDNPNHHEENVKYAQIASFAPSPAGGVTVATTSTTDRRGPAGGGRDAAGRRSAGTRWDERPPMRRRSTRSCWRRSRRYRG